MESVRTDDPLAPEFRVWSVERIQVNNVDPFEETNSLAFQALVVCLRILGVELDPSILNESSTKRYLIFSIGIFFLLLNGFCTIFTAVVEHNGFAKIYNNEIISSVNYSSVNGDNNTTIPSVISWSLIVDYVNYGVLAIGVHAFLVLFSHQRKWKSLWNNVQQILEHHNEFKDLKKSIRRVTIAGLVDISIV